MMDSCLRRNDKGIKPNKSFRTVRLSAVEVTVRNLDFNWGLDSHLRGNDNNKVSFMDELIDILDEHGNPTGQTCLKSEAHRKGLFHPTIHVWFYTEDAQMLFQKRAHNKDTFPSLWDVSVAGHIGAGEDITEAALREVEEEIGLSISASDLKKIGLFKSMHKHSETLIDNEFHHVFVCVLTVSLSNLNKQDTEVDDLKLVPLKDFKAKVVQNNLDGFVPPDLAYYTTVIAEIEKRLPIA